MDTSGLDSKGIIIYLLIRWLWNLFGYIFIGLALGLSFGYGVSLSALILG